MNKILAYDAETTGFPAYKEPSDSPKQPHLVQLAAILVDADTSIELSSMDVIIRPDGWVSEPDVLEIHGITHEMAMDIGIPEGLAIEMFYELQQGATPVAYNRPFDYRIMRIGMMRYFEQSDVDGWAVNDRHPCAMQMARKIMADDPSPLYDNKVKKLAVAYKYFTGKDLVGAHNAKVDAEACMEIYLAILKRQQAKEVAA